MKTHGRFFLTFISLFFQVYLPAQVRVGTAGGLHVAANTVITILGITTIEDATTFSIDESGKARFGGILASSGNLNLAGDIEFFNNVVQTNSFSMSVKNLTINSGSSLTINPSKNLSVNGTLNNQVGNTGLVLKSSGEGTASLLHNTDNVPATIQRYITGSSNLSQMKYHFVSVPLTNGGTSNQFSGSYLFDFNEIRNLWNGLGSSASTPLNNERGYMIYFPGDANITYQLSGNMNNDVFTALTTFTTDNDTIKGYNLVPNPYPSSVNWMSAGWTKTNISSTIWIWNNGTYATFNSSSPDSINGGSRFIGAGQSFFVKATTSAPSLIFSNTVRMHYPTAFLKLAEEIPDRLKIIASTAEYSDEAIVKFNNDASSQEDDYDSRKLPGLASVPQLYSLAGGHKLAINTLPVSTPDITVPLCFELDNNQACMLDFSGIETFINTLSINLEDLVTGQWTDLLQNNQYNFEHMTGNRADRFLIHFGGATSVNDLAKSNVLKVYLNNGLLSILAPGLEGQFAEITIFNALGQPYSKKRQVIGNITQMQAPVVAGVYLVRLISGNKQFVAKIIINS